MKDIQIRKEKIKLPLFLYNMIVYIENLKKSSKKNPPRISEFSKYARYKINMQKIIVFLYKCNEYIDTEIKNTTSF